MIKYSLSRAFRFTDFGIQITKESAGNLVIQLCFAVISFVSMILLTRILGADNYGIFSNAIAWVNILALLAPFGFGTLLIREIAIYKSLNKPRHIIGIIHFSDLFALLFSLLLIAILVLIASTSFSDKSQTLMNRTLLISSLLIPLWSFAVLRQSAIRGIEKSIYAMLPDAIIRPLLTIIGIIVFLFCLPFQKTAINAIIISIFASIAALIVAVAWWKKFRPVEVNLAKPTYEVKSWLNSAAPLFFLNGAQIIIAQSPMVLIGLFGETRTVGFFNIAFRLSSLLLYLPIAIGTVVSPMIARMFFNDEKAQLENLLKTATIITVCFDIFLVIIFVIYGKPILSIFGHEYVDAYHVLVILVLGGLLDGALGNSSLLLSMANFEKIVAVGHGCAAFASIVISILVLPRFGYVGVAFVFTLVLSILRVIFCQLIKQKMKMNISIFSWFVATKN